MLLVTRKTLIERHKKLQEHQPRRIFNSNAAEVTDSETETSVIAPLRSKPKNDNEEIEGEKRKHVKLFIEYCTDYRRFNEVFPDLTEEEFEKSSTRMDKIIHLYIHWTLKGPDGKPYFNQFITNSLVVYLQYQARKLKVLLEGHVNKVRTTTGRRSILKDKYVRAAKLFLVACDWFRVENSSPRSIYNLEGISLPDNMETNVK